MAAPVAPDPSGPASLGAVIIGRNEGERFKRCLASVGRYCQPVVYVDSGSTDGSVAWALTQGATVVELDRAVPFTAARARNAGFTRLLALQPDLQWVQFVDGDCEIVPQWIPAARQFIQTHAQVAVVCGRRRERYPRQTLFNAQCDREWDTPVGEARYCGGDALIRSAALAQVGGYRESLIAGEEPELCVRLRSAGWKIWRIADEMTLHDAAIRLWRQWWRRSRRAGYAYAEGAALHGEAPERHFVRESRRALLWGALPPLAALAMLAAGHWWGFLALGVYPLQILRLILRSRHRGAMEMAVTSLTVLAKFPEAQGVLEYRLGRLLGRRRGLIEYK